MGTAGVSRTRSSPSPRTGPRRPGSSRAFSLRTAARLSGSGLGRGGPLPPDAPGRGLVVSLDMADRWQSESIESTLMHTGDKLEEPARRGGRFGVRGRRADVPALP